MRTRTAAGSGSIGIAVDEDGGWATSLGGAGRADAASGLAELFRSPSFGPASFGPAPFGAAPCS
ncbi:Biofilm PGA outer membrane secretin PgaA [Actinosynnema pretiosum subsp. pretiosum]|nr:Biofilm PGA outer membrane secretin PgaA [Actinosynnema pretiosum subsp. pretiosum]